MSARSRNKGAKWEREVARRFREVGIAAERSLSEARDGNTGDLDLPASVPLTVQCKTGARPPIYRAVAQAVEAAGVGRHPVAIVHRDGSRHVPADELAVMPLADFLELVEALHSVVWR